MHKNSLAQRYAGYDIKLHRAGDRIIRQTDMEIPDETIQHNRELKAKTSWKGEETLKVASVPMNLVMKIVNETGIPFEDLPAKIVVKYLKDHGHEDFITYGGKF